MLLQSGNWLRAMEAESVKREKTARETCTDKERCKERKKETNKDESGK
jgi:hypothetical protein